MFDTVY